VTILDRLLGALGLQRANTPLLPNESDPRPTSLTGVTVTPENAVNRLYRQFGVDFALRNTILDIRRMDREDSRVKRIHGRMARAAVKGGLRLEWQGPENAQVARHWQRFKRRLHLHRQDKLESDCRGLVMEGNLPVQWVLRDTADGAQVAAAVRMPTETLVPLVGETGQFDDPAAAYEQHDLHTSQVIARFALWQLTLERLDPDNYDDPGCFGRPYLDAARAVWKKLVMTEENLVIRRQQRAPVRLSHVLEGATQAELEAYKAETEQKKGEITTDFYTNKKGSVTAVQGDANLDQIADVGYLLDTFFSGAPAPKGLFGYTEGLNRDILEDLKKDFFEELDGLQDNLALVYRQGFELDLLLAGIDPLRHAFNVQFSERRTESRNQRADLALKYQALGVSRETAWEVAGLEPGVEKSRVKKETKDRDPYPDPGNIRPAVPGAKPDVSITPGNRRKGESATDISMRGAA